MIDLFTKQERILLLFLIAGLLIGAAVKLLKPNYKNIAIEKPRYGDFQRRLEATTSLPDTIKKVTGEQKVIKKKRRLDFKIDINKATVDEIVRLPKIGPVLAKRIVTYREQKGYFRSVDDLINVKGVGQKTLEKLKPFIIIASEK